MQTSDEAQQLAEMLRNSSLGFSYFDASDRLSMWNETYAQLNFRLRDSIRKGVSFEDLLDALIARGQIAIPEGGQEKWVQERLRARRHGTTAFRLLANGNAYLVQERKDPLGGTLGFWLNVTDLFRQGTFKGMDTPVTGSHRDLSDPGTLDLLRTRLTTIQGNLQFLEATVGSQSAGKVIADALNATREIRDLLEGQQGA